MTALHMKLMRDLVRLWPQALAIALVLAAGVATMVLGNGEYQSLFDTRANYYETSRFADLFVSLQRAPKDVAADIALIDGVAEAEPRIVKIALADLPNLLEPASVMLISLPDTGSLKLNHVVLRNGRMPEPGSSDEVLISESFGKANGFAPGSNFNVLLNGVRRNLKVTGWALSPEYVFTIGPGDLMPDERRFGIVWISEKELGAAYNLTGAFSSLLVKLVPGTAEAPVIQAIDNALERYGGQGALGRKYQVSHAFLDSELIQLQAISRVLPPIFLVVSAFLVNMTLSRMIALEREQVGLLKALGYSSWSVALHYLEFVAVIAIIGSVIGMALGNWLGAGMAELYTKFYRFPSLVFTRDPQVYAIAAIVSVGAALAGALKSAFDAARLSPAAAMAPPQPPRYRKLLGGRFELSRFFPQSAVINIRHLVHWPGRTAGGILGVAMAGSILVGSLWAFGSMAFVIDFSFNRSDRQDASIYFPETRPLSAAYAVARLPGVLTVEPFRNIDTEVSFGAAKRRVVLMGRPSQTDLSQVFDPALNPLPLPDSGVILSTMLADILKVKRGDTVSFKLLEGERRTIQFPVVGLAQSYFGLSAFINTETLNHLLREEAMTTGVNIRIDSAHQPQLFAALKTTPATRFVTLQKVSMRRFRETLAQNMNTTLSVYLGLAAIIAFGVVYNFARISLSEQGREMASLRVLGFTRSEVSFLLLSEMAIVVLIAQPLGWLIGYVVGQGMAMAFETELYRMPALIGPEVYAYATITVGLAALVSALIVRRRIDQLDMVAVLKTRE